MIKITDLNKREKKDWKKVNRASQTRETKLSLPFVSHQRPRRRGNDGGEIPAKNFQNVAKRHPVNP